MHRQLPAERLDNLARGLRFKGDKNADLAKTRRQQVVDIGRDKPLPHSETRHPAQHKVLADAPHQLGQFLYDRAAGARIGHLLQRLDIAITGHRKRRDGPDEGLKQLVPRDEIGFGVDLDDGARRATRRNADKTVDSDPAGLLRGGGEAFLAQPVNRSLDIAAGIAERTLAIHHSGAGPLAQFFDQRCRYLGHRINPLVNIVLSRRYFAARVASDWACSLAVSSDSASGAGSSHSSSSSGTTSAGS